MLSRNVVDKFLNKNRFANTRAAEKTDFSALEVRRDKVNDLNSRFKNLLGGFLLLKCRRGTVNFPLLLGFGLGLVVNGFAEQVEHASESLLSDRYLY